MKRNKKIMRFNIRKTIPIVFFIFGIFYIIFSFSIIERKMIGDVRDWDPGSRAMPLGVGIIILLSSIYLFFKESRITQLKDIDIKEEGKENDHHYEKVTQKLILFTIILSVLYILLFRKIGFIICTVCILYILMFSYTRNDFQISFLLKSICPGLLFTLGYMLVIYSMGRWITRSLFFLGRNNNINILNSHFFIAVSTFIILLLIFIIIYFIIKKSINQETFNSTILPSFISVGITEFLYIVFKQIFWVDLAKGIIFW